MSGLGEVVEGLATSHFCQDSRNNSPNLTTTKSSSLNVLSNVVKGFNFDPGSGSTASEEYG